MASTAFTVNPIIIQDYTNITLSWDMWLDIYAIVGDNWDNLSVFYSYDGGYWWYIGTYRGDLRVWQTEEIFIPGSGDSLYIKFEFQTGWDPRWGEGVYLDDIKVQGDVIPLPNLTYYQPSGWDDPIVISAQPGTNQNSPVYADEPIYVDFSVANFGGGTAVGTTCHLLVDGQLAYYFSNIPPLAPWYAVVIEDSVIQLSEGWHTIRLVIDSLNWVPEESEANNTYERQFYVEEPTITVTGSIAYYDPTPAVQGYVPARRIKVEMWDEDESPIPDDLLIDTVTDYYGYFATVEVDNTDNSGKLDLFFRIYALNEASKVVPTLNYDAFRIQTQEWSDLLSGEYQLSVLIDSQSSGPFFIADAVLEARDKWLDLRSSDIPVQVEVVWDTSGTGTEFNQTNRYIHIEGKVFPYYLWPDTYDRDRIYHEYAHVLQCDFSFLDQGYGPHSVFDYLTLELAAKEGFATFLSNIFTSSSIMRNYTSDFQDSVWLDLENCETNSGPGPGVKSVNNWGAHFEVAVAGIFWDIYDYNDDDYSTFGFTTLPNLYNPDGVGDTLSDGIDNILDVLLVRKIGGFHPVDIEEFWQAWFTTPAFDHLQAMRDIWYEHGEIKGCCVGIRGNVDGDPQEYVDIADLLYLVDFMFGTPPGPPPPCMEEGNVDGLGGIDISDLLHLTDYIFGNPPGPAPVACP